MNYLHLPSSLRSKATAWNFPLGIEGFRYADLNRVRRLMSLYQVFRDELRAADPVLSCVTDRDSRLRLFAKRDTSLDSQGIPAYRFDLVLRGENETPFFAD